MHGRYDIESRAHIPEPVHEKARMIRAIATATTAATTTIIIEDGEEEKDGRIARKRRILDGETSKRKKKRHRIEYHYVCPFHSNCYPSLSCFAGPGKRILPDISEDYADYFGSSAYAERAMAATVGGDKLTDGYSNSVSSLNRRDGNDHKTGLYSSSDALFKHVKKSRHGTTFGSIDGGSYACNLVSGGTICNGTRWATWKEFRNHIRLCHIESSEVGFFRFSPEIAVCELLPTTTVSTSTPIRSSALDFKTEKELPFDAIVPTKKPWKLPERAFIKTTPDIEEGASTTVENGRRAYEPYDVFEGLLSDLTEDARSDANANVVFVRVG